MAETLQRILGFELPSNSPLFLRALSFHVLLGVACAVLGIAAMLIQKRPGKHPQFGTAYYWCLGLLLASATVLAVTRWSEDYYLFILGAHADAEAQSVGLSAEVVESAKAIRDRHEDTLMSVPGAVGTGIGAGDQSGQPAIEVFVEKLTPEAQDAAAEEVEGLPVKLVESGKFVAY